MELSELGYNKKWLSSGILTEEVFNQQLEEIKVAEDKSTENFRYATLMDWIKSKDSFTDKDIENFFNLTIEEEDQIMGGMAIRELFASPLLTDQQFETLKQGLPEFGKWTEKHIAKQDLERQLTSKPLTKYLYAECLNYKMKYDDNRLLIRIINESDDISILENFSSNGCGKNIRKMADKKIKKIKREQA